MRVTASEFARNFGRFKEEAQIEPIAITSYGRVSGYFMSAREYEQLTRRSDSTAPENTGLRLMDILRSRKAAIERLAHEHGARHLRIFGSVARGEERPDSDVDILVELPNGYDILRQRVRLTQKLAEAIGRKVDLIVESEMSPRLAANILAEAVEL
jgi:predicted nucleotidyltransferase